MTKQPRRKYRRKVKATSHKKVYPSRQKSPVVHKSSTGRKYIMVAKGAEKKGLKRKYIMVAKGAEKKGLKTKKRRSEPFSGWVSKKELAGFEKRQKERQKK